MSVFENFTAQVNNVYSTPPFLHKSHLIIKSDTFIGSIRTARLNLSNYLQLKVIRIQYDIRI